MPTKTPSQTKRIMEGLETWGSTAPEAGMKVFVSTQKTQGQRADDFCHVLEGELVRFCFQHHGAKIDDSCGCRRSMCGISFHKATTTMMVVEMPGLPLNQLQDLVLSSLVDSGHYRADDPDAAEAAEMEAKALADRASRFRVGAVVEKRGNRFQERQP